MKFLSLVAPKPKNHIHIIVTYVLADFAFDDLALLDLAALVVVLRCV